MNYRHLFFFLLLCITTSISFAQSNEDSVKISPLIPPQAAVAEVNLTDYTIGMEAGSILFSAGNLNGETSINLNGEPKELLFQNGLAKLPFEVDAAGKLALFQTQNKSHKLYHFSQQKDGSYRIRHIPMWLSIIPPLMAIALALLFKEVIVSLFVGVWAGSFIAGGLRIDSLYYFLRSFWEVVQKYVIEALNDPGHLSVMVFSLLIGGMVAIISRNGGMAGVVLSLSKYARTARSAQFTTWLLGVAIFFDDYANTLIVGNTMRSVTDKFKVSREKLAYIVDSTAAPVTAIAFITTWIGAELGYIDGGMKLLENYNGPSTPYALFLDSLKYSFYPVLTLIFMLILIFTRRDFGKMFLAEKRARTTGKVSRIVLESNSTNDMEDLSPVKGASLKWHNAFIPVAVVILITLFGLVDTGMAKTYSLMQGREIAVASHRWGDIWAAFPAFLGGDVSFFVKIGTLIGNADSFLSLLWASASGVAIAIIMTLSAKIMRLADTMNTLITGFKTILPALMILTLAWSLANTTEDLHTAKYLSFVLQDSINPFIMPGLVFILAGLISFSTGSSWSTMAILYPIAIPTSWSICQAQGLDHDISLEIMLNVIAVVLAASVMGDHCSPISDTTILSSLASDCNHIDHVQTQLPYALTVGGASVLAGSLATLLGGSWLISFLLGIASTAFLFAIILKLGKRVE